MIKNYFKIAFRNLWKNRFFTFLNGLGLSIGLAVSLVLMLFVVDELSFDRYHEQAADIYRVGITVDYDDTREKWAQVPNIAGPSFKENISEVIDQVRFLRHNFGRTAFVRVGEKNFAEEDLYWADSSLFNVFDVPLLYGDPQTALNEPNKVILSRSAAEKIFGKEQPLGKVIKVDNTLDLKISGVYEDFPANSTLDCAMIGSFNTLKWASENLYWSNCSFETFLLMHPTAKKEDIEVAMNVVLDDAVEKNEQWFSFWLQPMLDVHLHSRGIAESGYSSRLSDISQVRIMTVLALAILLLACFNYINMTTARSRQRFREVGINKTLGASSGQMIARFFVETGILVAAALLFGILMVEMSLPLFESLAGRSLSVLSLLNIKWLAALAGVWALITFGAGLYPALFLSSFSPGHLLQPMQGGVTGNRFFRQSLVVGQFVVCITLIVGALIFNRQLDFISQKKLGFQPDKVVAINTFAAEEYVQIEGLMNAYRNLAEVKTLCRAQGFPGMGVSGYSMTRPGQEEINIGVNSNHVTSGFDEVLELKYLAGKTLPEKSKEDTTVQVVMNEAGVKFLGWTPEEAIGKSPPSLYNVPATIVGVVEDFHHESMHNPITPYVFNNGNNFGWTPFLLVKLHSGELQKTLRQMEIAFSRHLPKSAFEFTFLDDHTERLYNSERYLSRIVLIFTLLAIFISCLGLFGLAAFTAERRTKEIGIRKVLGASVAGIVALLSKDFLKLVLIALVIATPLAYYFMENWLADFAYRIDMHWWIFVLAGALAITIAFLTVGFQSLRAAFANPVDSLRNE